MSASKNGSYIFSVVLFKKLWAEAGSVKPRETRIRAVRDDIPSSVESLADVSLSAFPTSQPSLIVDIVTENSKVKK